MTHDDDTRTDLEAAHALMAQRDFVSGLPGECPVDLLRELADDVPGLVAEVERLRASLAHHFACPPPCGGVCEEAIDASNRASARWQMLRDIKPALREARTLLEEAHGIIDECSPGQSVWLEQAEAHLWPDGQENDR